MRCNSSEAQVVGSAPVPASVGALAGPAWASRVRRAGRRAPKGVPRLLSPHMATRDPLAEEAVVLAGTLDSNSEALEAAVQKLAESGDRPGLEGAQKDLVRRIQERSDDFEATAALGLVNRALAAVGWTDPYSWKHRRKP